MPKILLSARDTAAAHHIAALIGLGTRPGWQIVVVAQSPALQILERQGHSCIPVALPPVTETDDPSALLALARDILASEKPNLIVAGLSSPGNGGIDEALLALRTVPALLMQDFWGEQNGFFGRGADGFLALDSFAAEINWRRHDKPSFVVGSPRHARLATLDLAAERLAVRQGLKTTSQQVVFGWFGQSLHHLAGYRNSVIDWLTAVAQVENCLLLYKPHPREDDAARRSTEELIAAAGLPHRILSGWNVEQALLGCDVATSILSNCLYDAAYLNYFSTAPLIAPVAWLAEPDLRSFFNAVVPIRDLPYTSAGLAMEIFDPTEFATAISSAASRSARTVLWQAARHTLTDPRQATDLVAQAIRRVLG